MRRKGQSQWEFDELFPADTPGTPPRVVHTVTELTARIRRQLEQQFGTVAVTGEVSNLRSQSSGHVYFTLKDGGAQLSCVLWRSTVIRDRELVRDGQKLVVEGDLTVYEPRGQYQLVVRFIELQGVGALQLAFERLKQKLSAEGLFATERKRGLPRYPTRIGVVTSLSGAAIRDVMHVLERRDPGLELVLAASRVQGEGAAAGIAEAIALLNAWSASQDAAGRLDLILVTRGGGSLEDLWPFNEECVARAIYGSALPVVSAVGHEIDFTISDFVADLRAATPSAAAEIISESVNGARPWLADLPARFRLLVHRKVAGSETALRQVRQRLNHHHPRRVLNERLQLLDELMGGMGRCVRSGKRHCEQRYRSVWQRLQAVRPSHQIARRAQGLAARAGRLWNAGVLQVRAFRDRLGVAEARLRLLSPRHVLDRGYSLTTDASTGRVLRSAVDIVPGQRLRTRLQRGTVESLVQTVQED